MRRIYMLLAGALLWTTAGFSQNGDDCSVAVEITADGDYTVADLTGTGAIESSATAAACRVRGPVAGAGMDASRR